MLLYRGPLRRINNSASPARSLCLSHSALLDIVRQIGKPNPNLATRAAGKVCTSERIATRSGMILAKSVGVNDGDVRVHFTSAVAGSIFRASFFSFVSHLASSSLIAP